MAIDSPGVRSCLTCGRREDQHNVRHPFAALGEAQRGPVTPQTARETVSPHQVAAMARILGLDPDNVVSIHAEQTHVDVVTYQPPAGADHPALHELRYLVQR